MTRTVYIGFMDEEVAPVLRRLLASENVLVVERQAFDALPQLLFEVPLQNLPTRPWVRSTPNPSTVVGTSVDGALDKEQLTLATALATLLAAPDQGFLKKLAGRTFFDSRIAASRREKVERENGNPALGVFAFPSTSAEATTTAVLVRAPEMGMQPTLVRPYLRLILKAVRSLEPLGGAVDLRAFGASGAISATSRPGSVHTMDASLFVGAEVDEGDNPSDPTRRLHSLVALATRHGRAYYHRVASAVVPDTIITQVRDAQRDALGALSDASSLKVIEVVPPGAPGPWNGTTTLSEAIAALGRDGGKTSLTTSFFVDSELKTTARALGLDAANTEDYHVLRLAESMTRPAKRDIYPPLEAVRVSRVDADPAEISSEIVTAFTQWARHHTITGQQVAALIGWGLRGTPLTEAATVPGAFWSFADDPLFANPETAARYFLRYSGADNVKPLDPFAVEIAVDFLKDLRGGGAFGPFRPTPPAELTEWAQRLHATLPDETGPVLDEFPALWAAALDDLRAPAGSVWVRLGKWKDNQDRWLSKLPVEASVVDRAFYRSANAVALLDAAVDFTRSATSGT